jgi:prevent-host-death family protein
MTEIVNIHDAKTHLSRLVEQAVQGREFVIAKAGKPMVRVVAVKPLAAKRELGFMIGQGVATADIKQAFATDIATMFPGP